MGKRGGKAKDGDSWLSAESPGRVNLVHCSSQPQLWGKPWSLPPAMRAIEARIANVRGKYCHWAVHRTQEGLCAAVERLVKRQTQGVERAEQCVECVGVGDGGVQRERKRFLKPGSYYAAQASVDRAAALLPWPAKAWDYKWEPLQLAVVSFVFFFCLGFFLLVSNQDLK